MEEKPNKAGHAHIDQTKTNKPMRIIFCTLFAILLAPNMRAQRAGFRECGGHFSGPYTAPLLNSTDRSNLSRPHWDLSLETYYRKNKAGLWATPEVKARKQNEKEEWLQAHDTEWPAAKTAAVNPVIGTNFKGNELKTWTPTDNTIAVSDSGRVVSAINYGIAYYDTAGTSFLLDHTWDAFLNDSTLNQGKFDPRVIYDRKHDRFIVVLLHGFSSSTSKVLVCFSKSGNPLDGWNIYALSGNPYNDTTWTDFPTIGLNDDELFINANRFGNAPNYDWKETYVMQIRLQEGYAGQPLQFGLWNGFTTPDGKPGITCYPAADGQGLSRKDTMYFVCLMPDTGSKVYVFRIDGPLGNANASLSAAMYPIPPYEVCANAFQKDPTTGAIDSLYTASAWTQNAYRQSRTLHFTFSADIQSGWCGLKYGRIWLDSNRADVVSFGMPGTDLTYPAVASFGYDSNDHGAVIAYVQSDTTMTPQCGVISVDHALTWSSMQTVKAGDTVVNILYPPSYPVMPERWGDYTGICRKFNSAIPQAWMAAAYGANTPPRLASFGTWITKLSTAETPPAGTLGEPLLPTGGAVYPNPLGDRFSVEFETPKAGRVTVRLFDASGRLVRTLFDDELRASRNRIGFNRMMLPVGMYILRVEQEQAVLLSTKVSVR